MKIKPSVFIPIFLVVWTIILSVIYFVFVQPIGSIKLYQDVNKAKEYKDISKLIDDEYIGQFTEADFNTLKDAMSKDSPNEINEYSIFKYNDQWILIEKSPGIKNNILNIKVLNEDEVKTLDPFFN